MSTRQSHLARHRAPAAAQAAPHTVRSGAPDKVPALGVRCWVVAVLATVVGVTAADYLGRRLGLGLSYSTALVTGMLVVALAGQLATRRHVPAVFWSVVLLVDALAPLVVTDLTDDLGLPPTASLLLVLLLLGGAVLAWHVREGGVAVRRVVTRRHECLLWLALLLASVVGAATRVLLVRDLGAGTTGVVAAVLLGMLGLARWRLRLAPAVAVGLAWVLAWPVGAALGDLAARSHTEGGLAWGVGGTGLACLGAVVVLVAHLQVSARGPAPTGG